MKQYFHRFIKTLKSAYKIYYDNNTQNSQLKLFFKQ